MRNRELIDRLLGPAEPEVSCEGWFALLDPYESICELVARTDGVAA